VGQLDTREGRLKENNDGEGGLVSLGEHVAVAPLEGEIKSDVVDSVEGIRALAPDYEHLYRVTANTLPFALHDWHLAWCEHFLHHDSHAHEQLLFHVLRDGSGECIALVPLVRTRRRLGPLKLATVDLVGMDPGLTEIRTPLIKPGYERAAVRVVHGSLAQIGGWDWMQWSRISGTLAEAVGCEVTPHWREVSRDYVLDLPASWQQFRAGLTRNARECVRHCYNSLRRDRHTFEFVVARTRDEVREALDRFLVLHALRANMQWGPKHPNFFSTRPLREFLYDVCDRLAARDVVRIFQLRVGSEIVASRIAFVVGDSLYLYYSGFDPVWARYSVMTTTIIETFKYAIANGIKTVNLSLNTERSKLRWRPRLIEFQTALVRRGYIGSRLLYRAYYAAMSGTSAHSAHAQLLKIFLANRTWD
jgi:CelD/BcsL family acetyltransferase involved in cellulose biosynthesis